MSDLRQLLNDSSLKEFTYDEQSFENKIDYAVDEVIKVFRRWLSGKLVAGSEKANSHNEVILKLLHELDYQQEKEVKEDDAEKKFS